MVTQLLLLNKRKSKSFVPSSISGYTVHYDFGDTSTLYQDSSKTVPVASDGDVIGVVENKAQPGVYDAVQATTASKPVWCIGGYGESDGVDDNLGMDLSTVFQGAGTGFIAFRRTNAANDKHIWHVPGQNANTYHWYLGVQQQVYDGFLSANRPLVATNSTIDTNNIVVARQDGSNLLYRINNTETYNAPQTYQAPSALNTGVLFSGRRDVDVSAGRIYEVILYDRALTADEINQVEAYLNAKVAAF